MSEPRKHHLNIDGAQLKEEECVDSYKAFPESDQEFRISKTSLGKSKEKVSDPAEEKLLNKEDEAKIVTRVDMAAEAKYVVGDHRNGDAKVELDANKRQFSGLTKEELLKYADDPFWVRLRWFMFVLFWALWLAMLAGAIAIIVRAPKCDAPPPRTWYEIGPLVDSSVDAPVNYEALEADLPLLEEARVRGLFINPCENTYEVLDSDTCIDKFKEFLVKAKEKSIKVIVDLTANFVSTSHEWFKQSENRSAEFDSYFVWADGKGFDDTTRKPPNNWVSYNDEPAWSWSESRQQFYLQQYGGERADLNFREGAVVRRFDTVLDKWLKAGADGIRLLKVRQLLVNSSLPDESPDPHARGAVHGQYAFLAHKHTADQPALEPLLARWASAVAAAGPETVFTIHEDGRLQPEWYRLRARSVLRPPSAAPARLDGPELAAGLADRLTTYASNWTALQLTAAEPEASVELASFSMLLPGTPVLLPQQLHPHENDTIASQRFAHLSALRDVATVKYGQTAVAAVPAAEPLLALARWRPGGTGYVAVFNPGDEAARANLTGLARLPATLAVHHVSHAVHLATNYTSNKEVETSDVLVPARCTLVLSYAHEAAVEQ